MDLVALLENQLGHNPLTKVSEVAQVTHFLSTPELQNGSLNIFAI